MGTARMAPSPVRCSTQSPIDRSMCDLSHPPRRAASGRLRQGGNLPAAYPELPVADLVFVLEQCPGWWPGRAGAVLVVHAAVAGAHEQSGLREPADGAAEMRAVDREDLKPLVVDSPHPAWDIGGGPVPGDPERVFERRQPRLALGKALDEPQLDPGLGATPTDGAEEIADHRDADQGGRYHVQGEAQLEQEAATR